MGRDLYDLEAFSPMAVVGWYLRATCASSVYWLKGRAAIPVMFASRVYSINVHVAGFVASGTACC